MDVPHINNLQTLLYVDPQTIMAPQERIDDSGLLPPTSSLPTVYELFDRIADASPKAIAVATIRNTASLSSSYVENTSFEDLRRMSQRAAYFLTSNEYGINLRRGWVVLVGYTLGIGVERVFPMPSGLILRFLMYVNNLGLWQLNRGALGRKSRRYLDGRIHCLRSDWSPCSQLEPEIP